MKNFSLFGWVDKFDDSLLTLLTMLGSRLNYYWQQMTLLSALILVMILAICGLAWLQILDRKKFGVVVLRWNPVKLTDMELYIKALHTAIIKVFNSTFGVHTKISTRK